MAFSYMILVEELPSTLTNSSGLITEGRRSELELEWSTRQTHLYREHNPNTHIITAYRCNVYKPQCIRAVCYTDLCKPLSAGAYYETFTSAFENEINI